MPGNRFDGFGGRAGKEDGGTCIAESAFETPDGVRPVRMR